jgi:hypothetical protein
LNVSIGEEDEIEGGGGLRFYGAGDAVLQEWNAGERGSGSCSG